MKFGLQLWSQQTDWPTWRDSALAAEAAGWDSVWTWDHVMAIFGPWEQPIFEGWMTLAGTATLTSRVRLGLMVGANTFRNPALTAKVAITLDHLSGGRAVLGIGGAWFEREHEAYGIHFGTGFGERLDRLDESVMLIRRLLDGERFSHEGRFYTLHDALCEPRPVQAHLPILVGGSGPRKTLRTTARYADLWNGYGEADRIAAVSDTLRERCLEEGILFDEIERTVTMDVVIRRWARGGHRAIQPDRGDPRHRRAGGSRRDAARPQRRRNAGGRGGLSPAVRGARGGGGHLDLPQSVRSRDDPSRGRGPGRAGGA